MTADGFYMMVTLIALVLFVVHVSKREKDMLIMVAAFLIWMFVGFDWLLNEPFTALGITGDYVDVIKYVPWLLCFVSPLLYMTKANKVEIQRKMGNVTWSEFGDAPPGKSSLEKYRDNLYNRTRRRRRR